jgi:hypothetical protein
MFSTDVDIKSISASVSELMLVSSFIGALVGFIIKKLLQFVKGGS